MDPSNIKRIEAATARETEWVSEEQLIFKIADEPSFDIIPYLGEGPKCHILLTFAMPVNLTTGNIEGTFKIQAAEQGIHLTCVASCKNANSKCACLSGWLATAITYINQRGANQMMATMDLTPHSLQCTNLGLRLAPFGPKKLVVRKGRK
jgi:hypothetical protein